MHELALPLLIGLIVVALAFDFLNGLHDAANSIATVVGTRLLSPAMAVAFAAFFNFGAYFLAFEADWSYAYFIDTRRIPSALELALVLLDAVSVPVGFVEPL